jgi:5-methyltetrahydropteroyltriglutamate--homocysteine methyltransferase
VCAIPRPYRADNVGSLLRPPELLAARAARQRGEITSDTLRAIEDRAILDAVELQQQCGLDVFTDGEFRRGTFMGSLHGVSPRFLHR